MIESWMISLGIGIITFISIIVGLRHKTKEFDEKLNKIEKNLEKLNDKKDSIIKLQLEFTNLKEKVKENEHELNILKSESINKESLKQLKEINEIKMSELLNKHDNLETMIKQIFNGILHNKIIIKENK